MRNFHLTICIVFFLLNSSCIPFKEKRLMFSNIDWNSMSIRPVLYSSNGYTFRLYVNNGNSIDRIFTVSVDTLRDSLNSSVDITLCGDINYIGTKFSIYRGTPSYFYKKDIINEDRVDSIIRILTKHDFSKYESNDKSFKSGHDPFSSYIIEIKNETKYYTFRFISYPDEEINTNYRELERLFFSLFPEIKQSPL